MVLLQAQHAFSGGMAFLILLALGVILLFLYWKLIAIIARKRGRKTLPWFLLSFILSPVIVILLLLVLGETDEKRIERIKEEERIRREV